MALALGLLASCARPSAVPSTPPAAATVLSGASPRLVLLLAVDQLRPDRLSTTLPGGLGRLMREGRVFADAALEHADTETCPGHATMLTGRHPGPAGIPANEFVERDTGRLVYCVQDDAPDAAVLGGGPAPAQGRSPRKMRVSALGDWLKASQPGARVFSLSGKDRAAITLGGEHPEAAYWFDRGPAQGFTTSRYYRSELPAWVRAFNRPAGGEPAFLARVPDRWEHPTDSPANGARRDDYPAESAQFGRTSGHPVRDPDVRIFLEHLYYTPFLDDVTLDFARALVGNEHMGSGPGVDLLAISLSANDPVGHLYGPGSQEARDALLRLDAAVGEFLAFLEAEVGKGRMLVVLTADHGVLELPEWLVENGASECPLPTGRGSSRALAEGLAAALHSALDPKGSPVVAWMTAAGYALTVNRPLAEERHVPVLRVVDLARRWLGSQPGIVHVWTQEEIERGRGPAPFAALYLNSFDPERSGDLTIQPAPTCLFSASPTGTSHGTPYLYDRAVPLVFFGPGVSPGVVRGRAATVDIAPTLARAIGLELSAELDGHALTLQP
ncbi:MAG TPA: alkaline phosphatase family protein [Myxococcota bacterium]|nr:alkaline phosphatase family protein [Myxococcota bacterium]